jgi:hypothetical protein
VLAPQAEIFAKRVKPVAVELENAPRYLQRVYGFDWGSWGEAVRDESRVGLAGIESVYVMPD